MSTRALTLRRRTITATLDDRAISGGDASTNLASIEILQGFRYAGAFNTRAFLLYGLVGDWYTDRPGETLTLRRRKIGLVL